MVVHTELCRGLEVVLKFFNVDITQSDQLNRENDLHRNSLATKHERVKNSKISRCQMMGNHCRQISQLKIVLKVMISVEAVRAIHVSSPPVKKQKQQKMD
jgi:hypothetical protein